MRGGYKTRKKPKTGQEAFLAALWNHKGGVNAIAHRLGCHKQKPINWRNRGHVPLVLCNYVATRLDIDPWGLNYTAFLKFMSDKIPSWSNVVKSLSFTPEVTRYILSLEPPT